MIYLIALILITIIYLLYIKYQFEFEERWDGYYMVYYVKITVDGIDHVIPRFIKIWPKFKNY